MSHTSPLHQLVHRRFQEVFGPPSSALGRDDHWSLKPAPDAVSINVLVEGMPEVPAVWVFDPHDPDDGVMRTAVKDEEHLNDLIKRIQERVQRAALTRNGRSSPRHD